MRRFGLIGHPLTHSFSGKYFAEKFNREQLSDCIYELYDLEQLDKLPKLIEQHPDLIGLNVTIPYKEQVMDYLDELDEKAHEIGAVNTILIDPASRKLKGFNTDYHGFKRSLQPFLKNTHERALILGTGGASKAVTQVLKELGINYLYVSRNPTSSNEIGYDEVNAYVMKHHQLIINTTPVGTFPNVDTCPAIDYNCLTDEHLLYDLVYNPAESLFLQKGKAKQSMVINGLDMLKLQAEKAWEIWNG
ncbi:MAG: shikimate dehydrogenase [Flavobacteriales bacterium]|nr:shikimate dehydrogenase [Flavobacteriales bacterium]